MSNETETMTEQPNLAEAAELIAKMVSAQVRRHERGDSPHKGLHSSRINPVLRQAFGQDIDVKQAGKILIDRGSHEIRTVQGGVLYFRKQDALPTKDRVQDDIQEILAEVRRGEEGSNTNND